MTKDPRKSENDFYPDQPRPSYDRIEIPDKDEEVHELLKRSVEAANNSIVITDPHQPDNPIIYVNQGFKELTGYQEDEILGRNCRFLQIMPDGRFDNDQPAVATLRRAIDSGSHCRVVIRNYRKSGEMFWNELYLTPVLDGEENLVNFIGVQNDITERIQLNESLERRVQERTQELQRKTQELERQRDELERAKEKAEAASRAKSVFLANMSHEIRTPLTAILGLADVIRAKSESGKFEEHIRRIKSAGSRLMDTLSSLLTLAKLEAGNMEVDLEPVRVADEALEVVELFRERAQEKGLSMNFEVTPDARDVVSRLDTGAINSALQNLISNAIKFTESGEVSVSVFCPTPENGQSGTAASSVCIRVTDTGIGISDDFRPYLFEDFRQESDGLTREHEGSGLGLSIAKQLVEAMQGTIDVESESGTGSVFTICFPVDTDFQPVDLDEEGAVDAPRTDASVLLVEDNDNTIFLMEDLLEDVVDLSVAKDASNGVEMAREQAYDMLLIDINLGAGGSGVDLLRELRTHDTYAQTPMIAVTAIAMPGDRENLLSKGFDDYVSKPFEAEDLIQVIQHHLTA